MSSNVSVANFTTFQFVEVPFVDPNYLTVFNFELIELSSWRKWVGRNFSIAIFASVAYLVLITFGQIYMRNRRPMDLKQPLVIWNLSLSLFSAFGFLRVAPEFFHVLFGPNGLHNSVCVRGEHNAATAFWGLLFLLSKVVELGDTMFLVLRKKNILFLHWYHHLSVLTNCWYFYELYEPPFRWFMTINYFIHALMYSYYALMTLGIKVSKKFSMAITALQISQMIIGIEINLYSLWIKGGGTSCEREYSTILAGLVCYFSYFILFGNYFKKAYLNTFNKAKIL